MHYALTDPMLCPFDRIDEKCFSYITVDEMWESLHYGYSLYQRKAQSEEGGVFLVLKIFLNRSKIRKKCTSIERTAQSKHLNF